MKALTGDSYAEIIVGMMKDYNITMFDALLWDFESTLLHNAESLYESKGIKALENAFRRYLTDNGIDAEKDKDFYADIFMGRSNNMELGIAKTNSK